jgi:trehalose 2-sulfotransferase
MTVPALSYLICSTPRSGSTLLCEVLAATGVAGRPEEYYQHRRRTGLPRRPREYFEDAETPEVVRILGDYTRVDDEPSLFDPRRFPDYPSYLEWTIERGTTPNGVFGAKVMWGYFNGFVDSLRAALGESVQPTRTVLERSFPNLHGWIFVTRREKDRQAVSLWKAIQNWTWRRDEDTHQVTREPLEYSFDALHHLTRQLTEHEREWWAFFGASGLRPLTITYEDLTADYERAALAALEHLRIAPPAELDFGGLRMSRQADAQSDEWLERYRAQAGRRVPEAPVPQA